MNGTCVTLRLSAQRAARLAAGSGVLRAWLESRLPSGSGPDQATRDRSTFALTFVGKADGQRVVARAANWSSTTTTSQPYERAEVKSDIKKVTVKCLRHCMSYRLYMTKDAEWNST